MSDDIDWRLQSVAILNSSNDLTGEPQIIVGDITMVVVDQIRLSDGRLLSFPIPNPSAMMLDASRRAFVEAQDCSRTNR